MIFSEILPGNTMDCSRWSCSTPSQAIELPTSEAVKDICLCSFSNTSCEYFELAFTSFATVEDSLDEYKNDYRKFILTPLSLTSAFSFTLIDNSGVEHVIYSDTEQTEDYGEIFEQGFNSSQPLQVGVNVCWWKVAEVLGYGDYTVKTSVTDFGEDITNTTHNFRVVPFDTQRANGTIKVEVNNVGVTMNGKNWTGLFSDGNPFTNMIRLRGRLLVVDPDIEIESIEDGSRKDNPVQTKVTEQYTVNIENVPFDIGRTLVNEDIVMNWSVTDYNIFNEDLRDKEMIIQSTSVNNTPDYNRKSYELSGKNNISKLNRKFI